MLSLSVFSSLLEKRCISSLLLIQKNILITAETKLEVHIENSLNGFKKKQKQPTTKPTHGCPKVI